MDHTALLEQMKEWGAKGKYGKIIEAAEAVAEGERSYELTGQLARAYNNRGEGGDYDCAVSLLLSTEEAGNEDPNWHFRMGYAKYYLDQEWEALPALESNQFELQMHGVRIGCKDMTVWPEPLEDGQAGLQVYSEKLLPLLEEQENSAYSLMEILLDQSIGEVSSILHIGWLELLKEPKKEDGISLDQLAGYIQEHIDPDPAPANICERYMGYEMKPKDLSQEWELREDIFVGNTACPELINSYFQEDDGIVNEHQADGVVMGFLFYNNDAIEQSLMVPFRGEMEDEMIGQAGGIVDIIGGATGKVFSYIDFICYDLKTFFRYCR